MNRRDWLQVAMGSAAALGPGCSRQKPPKKIIVATLPHVTLSSLYLAHESGYFSQAGLDVELRQVGLAAESLALVAGGKVDVSFAGVTPSLVNAVAKGAKLRIVAGREVASACNETCTLFVSRKTFPGGLTDLRKLQGKRLAIQGVTMTHFCLDAFLQPGGISSKDLEIRTLRMPEAVAAMLADRIDAFVSSRFERDLERFKAATIRIKSLAEALPNYQYSFIVFGDSILSADPSVGARFLAAYLRGVREYVKGKTPKFLYDYAATNKLDPQAVEKACRDTVVMDGSVDLKSLEMFVDWSVRAGFSPQSVPAASLVDTRFIEQARKL